MNSTVVIVILSVISTALASILIYINQDAKKKTKELKSKLDDFLKIKL